MSAPRQPESKPYKPSPRKKAYSLDILKQKALDLQPLPIDQIEPLEQVISSLSQDREASSQNGKFKEGIRQLRAIEHTKEALDLASKKQYQREQKIDAQRQVEDVQSRIDAFDHETKEQENALKQSIAESRQRLLDECQMKADQHEEFWTSDQQRRKYNRASNHLRSLRFQVKNMLLSKRFQDAEQTLAIADALQEKEQEMNAAQMQADYEKATKLLNQKIQNELEIFDTTAQQQLDNFRKKRNDERTVFVNQMNKAQSRLTLTEDIDRLWNLNQKQVAERSVNTKQKSQRIRSSRVVSSRFDDEGTMVLSLPPLSSRRSLIRTNRQASYF